MLKAHRHEVQKASLLDRLTDDEPEKKTEITQQGGISQIELRRSVLRDLNWLFNCSNLAAVVDLDDYPEVANSVLNYGIPDLSGLSLSGIDARSIENLLRDAIIKFEPRITRRTVKVRLTVDDEQMNHNAMTFTIEGELMSYPSSIQLQLKTELNLECGGVRVYDYSGTI